MASDYSINHSLIYGSIAERTQRAAGQSPRKKTKTTQSTPDTSWPPNPNRGPFADYPPRVMPPQRLTEANNYQPVPSKKAHKNLGHKK